MCHGRSFVPGATIKRPGRKSSPRRAMSRPGTIGCRVRIVVPERRQSSSRRIESAPGGSAAPVSTSTAVPLRTRGRQRGSSPGEDRPITRKQWLFSFPLNAGRTDRTANPSIIDTSRGGSTRRERTGSLPVRPNADPTRTHSVRSGWWRNSSSRRARTSAAVPERNGCPVCSRLAMGRTHQGPRV